eukprot:919891-Alexandrium_andersonii.AAC.1
MANAPGKQRVPRGHRRGRVDGERAKARASRSPNTYWRAGSRQRPGLHCVRICPKGQREARSKRAPPHGRSSTLWLVLG